MQNTRRGAAARIAYMWLRRQRRGAIAQRGGGLSFDAASK